MKERRGKLEQGWQHVRLNGKQVNYGKKELDPGFGQTAAISRNNVGSSVCTIVSGFDTHIQGQQQFRLRVGDEWRLLGR